ncbi:MAG: hypothetical protein J0I20_11265 [Chloroflexi bacterium]|nr:hypothetical protein [Chloroflexota bacterium]OJV92327.1 MAG: hypothetical protein BGO39_30790 [Chloroflexi bacterium 54-19]
MASYTPNQSQTPNQYQAPAQPQPPYGYGQPNSQSQPYHYQAQPYAAAPAPAKKGLPVWAIIGGIVVVLGLVVGLLVATGVLKGSVTVYGGGMRVADVVLAKGYSNEEAVNPSTTFSPTDNPLHAVVKIENTTAGARVTGVWTVLAAGGETNLELGRKELSLEGGNTYTAHYSLELNQPWPVGKYKFEVYVNDKLEKTVEFTVK